MRHLKYLGTGALATVIAVVGVGCIVGIFFGMFWLVDNYPRTATAFTVLAFIYFLGFGIIEQREADAIAAEREAYHREQAEKLLTQDDEDGMV